MRLRMAGRDTDLVGDEVAESLAADGLVMVHEAGIGEIRDLLTRWTVPVWHPHEQEAGLTIISARAVSTDADGLAGFGRSWLVPHTDRSLDPNPPSLLAVVMLSPGSGGDGLVVDGARLFTTLCRSFGRSAVESLRMRARDGTTMPVVNAVDGLVRIRFRADPLASLYSETGQDAVVDAWRRLVSEPTALQMAAGDGYLVHNHRYLHGRSSFTGSRRLARFLAKIDDGHRLAWLNKGFRLVCP